jgi:hypothetical protein
VAPGDPVRADDPGPPRGGRGARDPVGGLRTVLTGALDEYRSGLWQVLPPFVVAFVGMRLLLPLLPDEGADRLTRLVLLLLVQVGTPALVGSVLFAYATAVFDPGSGQGSAPGSAPGSALGRLTPVLGAVGGAAVLSAVLSLIVVLLLGAVGLLVQPLLLGPPVLLQAIVLERCSMAEAWTRTKAVLRRDARIPLHLLVAVAIIGLVGLVLLAVVAPLTTRLDPDTRTLVQLAVHGAILGVTLPFVAAVGLHAYRAATGPAPRPGAPG